TKAADPAESNTQYAQGGIIDRGEDDSAELLARDIIEAGAGLSDPDAVQMLAEEGPRLVEQLLVGELQVPFDRRSDGSLEVVAEAAHSVPRIIHAHDTTGRAIERAVLEGVRRDARISIVPHRTAIDLLTLSHHSRQPLDVYAPPTCIGAFVFNQQTRQVEQ